MVRLLPPVYWATCRKRSRRWCWAAAAVPGGGGGSGGAESGGEIGAGRPRPPTAAQPSSQAARPGPPLTARLNGPASCLLPALGRSRIWSLNTTPVAWRLTPCPLAPSGAGGPCRPNDQLSYDLIYTRGRVAWLRNPRSVAAKVWSGLEMLVAAGSRAPTALVWPPPRRNLTFPVAADAAGRLNQLRLRPLTLKTAVPCLNANSPWQRLLALRPTCCPWQRRRECSANRCSPLFRPVSGRSFAAPAVLALQAAGAVRGFPAVPGPVLVGWCATTRPFTHSASTSLHAILLEHRA